MDFVFHLDLLPAGDSKHFTTRRELIGGGCAANAAVAIKRLGGDSALSCRVGDDMIGDLIIEDLRKHDVNLSLLQRFSNCSSSYSAVCIDAAGHRQVVNYRGSFPGTEPAWLADAPPADAYLADSVWMPGCKATMALARKRDRPGIVDAERITGLDQVKLASHLAFSSQGLHELTGVESPHEGLRRVREDTDAWICVTDGASGVYFFDGNSIERIRAFDIRAVDTLGAGDVWHGAFALGLAEGQDECDAMLFANAAAALKCSRAGGRVGYPMRSEVDALLESGIFRS